MISAAALANRSTVAIGTHSLSVMGQGYSLPTESASGAQRDTEMLQVFVEQGLEARLVREADDRFDDFATLEEQQCRN